MVLVASALAARPAHATDTPTNIPNDLRDAAATEAARDLLVRIDEALNNLNYTYYRRSDQYWSDSKGIYKVDCSGYINRMVEDATPTAYDRLRDARGTSRPKAEDYYYHFRRAGYYDTYRGWKRLKKITDLRPGDILVWRYLDDDSSVTGHMVVVASKPQRIDGVYRGYKLRVSDSARSGHSYDNRGSSGSGVGAGWMKFKVDSEGRPYRYGWTVRSSSSWRGGVSFALGRPIVSD